MTIKIFKLTAVALALAFLTGCTQNQILATLEASVAATETLVSALQAGGKIDPTVASAIEGAVAGLPAAFQETAAELASADVQALKAAKIAGYYASTEAALRALPPAAQVYASAISASIDAFLSQLPQGQSTHAMASRANVSSAPAARAAAGEAKVRFDAKRLNAIGARAAVLDARLGELKSSATKTSAVKSEVESR